MISSPPGNSASHQRRIHPPRALARIALGIKRREQVWIGGEGCRYEDVEDAKSGKQLREAIRKPRASRDSDEGGKPVVAIVPIEGADRETLSLSTMRSFWRYCVDH